MIRIKVIGSKEEPFIRHGLPRDTAIELFLDGIEATTSFYFNVEDFPDGKECLYAFDGEGYEQVTEDEMTDEDE